MPAYLNTVLSFAEVKTEPGIDTKTFLEAADGVVGLFDLLGSTAFAAVTSDISGNIKKVRTRYNSDPVKNATLQSLVQSESTEKSKTAREGLLWLLRGLQFTCTALLKAQETKTLELATAFNQAYEVTLKQFHNFVVKGVFSIAMKACPYRADFYAKLSHDPDGGVSVASDVVSTSLDSWLAALNNIITTMFAYYEANGYAKGL
ncbi:glycolipid transfer protein [Pluteus cervinus]|uniref:Glycolipid transfer protein n=1 Tax=Pluteus cervinus TaxID=181527 RepID=A0ACD3AYE8_9AGAR|nr:glycolipid transfer protein [Pluteus cervinus]